MKRSLRNTLFGGIGILANVNQTASDNAEEFGFRTVGRRPGYYEKPREDALIMTLFFNDQ